MIKKLSPLRGYVLLKLIDEEETTSSGLVIPDKAKDRQAKGLILGVGTPPYLPNGMQMLIQVEVGDVVWFKRFAGEEITEKDEKLMLVPYNELIGVYK